MVDYNTLNAARRSAKGARFETVEESRARGGEITRVPGFGDGPLVFQEELALEAKVAQRRAREQAKRRRAVKA